MKAGASLVLFIVLVLTTVNSFAQEFTVTTTNANVISSKASIDMPGLTGNPLAIIVAIPLGDTERINPHPIGAWYYSGKWNIFNTDHAVMPAGMKYKVQFFSAPGPNHFLHVITKQNLGDEGSYLDHPALNNNPNAQLKILQNHAPDNRAYNLNKFDAKAAYNFASRKWYIANVNGRPLYPNTAYNIVITSGGAVASNPPTPEPAQTPTPVATKTPPNPMMPPSTMGIAAQTSPQTPCTSETAYQTVGKWARQKKDDLAMADRTFPKAQYPLVLAKAQKVIELLVRANPEFKGIQAYAYRGIRGESITPNGALPFRVNAVYDSYICVGNDTYKVEARGKVLLNGVTNWTTVNFNSFGHVLESLSSGQPFLTADGQEIFEFPKQLGALKGFTLFQPRGSGNEKTEAVIIAPDNRQPYKPLTREEFLQASIAYYKNQSGNHANEIAGLNAAIEGMSPAERQIQAVIRNGAYPAMPGRSKLFVTEAEGGKRLVTEDRAFFDPKLPREAIQFITVYWSWDDQNPSKVEMIRVFKQAFDFGALKQMLGK